MILRFLVGINLLILAGLLGTALVTHLTSLDSAAFWWRTAEANKWEWGNCEQRLSVYRGRRVKSP